MGNNLTEIKNEIVLVSLSFLVLCFYPIFALFLIPLSLYRWIVKEVAKRDPKLGSILGGLDAVLAAHNTYTQPASVLVPYVSVSSKVDRNNLINWFNGKIFKPKDGHCLYPELKQKIVRRYGYHFWHHVEDFNLENHVIFLNPSNPNELVCQSELHSIISEDLVLRPFDSSKSPWELIIVPNYHDESNPQAKSLLLFRIHHCFFDGYSFMNIWQNLSKKQWNGLGGTAKSIELSWFQIIMQTLNLLLTGPYHLLKMVKFSNDTNKFFANFKDHPTGRCPYQETKLPLEIMKNVKNHFKVNLSSVVIATVAEGLEASMIKNGVLSKDHAPLKIHMTMPCPLPGHPDKLTNHWGFVKMPVVIYKNDPIKTLNGIDEEFERMRRSIKPFVGFYLYKIIGNLPVRMIPMTKSLVRSSCLLSNFPGPATIQDIFGYPVLDLKIGGTTPRGHAVAVAALSYNGSICLNSAGDSCNITSQDEANFLNDSIKQAAYKLQEIGHLYKISNSKY